MSKKIGERIFFIIGIGAIRDQLSFLGVEELSWSTRNGSLVIVSVYDV